MQRHHDTMCLWTPLGQDTISHEEAASIQESPNYPNKVALSKKDGIAGWCSAAGDSHCPGLAAQTFARESEDSWQPNACHVARTITKPGKSGELSKCHLIRASPSLWFN
jgi:hypothetical protein